MIEYNIIVPLIPSFIRMQENSQQYLSLVITASPFARANERNRQLGERSNDQCSCFQSFNALSLVKDVDSSRKRISKVNYELYA